MSTTVKNLTFYERIYHRIFDYYTGSVDVMSLERLRLEGVSFRYGKRRPWAVSDATVCVEPGIHVLLGENGAGKTTLLHLMSSLLFATEGKVLLGENDLSQRTAEALRRVFYLSDDFRTEFSTIESLVRHHACFYPTFNPELLRANLSDFGVEPKMKIKSMSLGTRHKAFLAYALSLGVDYLLLDEPANGMDLESKKAMRKMLLRCVGDDQSVVISTHNIHDLSGICDYLTVMRRNKVVLSKPVGDICQRIAFVTSSVPVGNAIYQELADGQYQAIVGTSEHAETSINYPLLFSALMNLPGDKFSDFLK